MKNNKGIGADGGGMLQLALRPKGRNNRINPVATNESGCLPHPFSGNPSLVRDHNGFTLIEIIMVISILGVLSLISFAFLGRTADTYQMASSQGKMNGELWVGMERMVRELQYTNAAANITAPALGATGSTLTFTKPACAICQDTSTAVSYTLTGTQLLRTTATMANQIVADGITAFSVARTAQNVLTITLTKTDGSNSMTMTESVYPHPSANLSEDIL